MTSRDVSQTAQTGKLPLPAGQAAEAAHMAGSVLLTASVAMVLTVVAIPVSIGLGLAWGARSLARRMRKGGK